MLITDEQRATMLENGREYARNPDFNLVPVVSLFDPLGSGTWLLTDLDPDVHDIASDRCEPGVGFSELGSIGI
ncbi:DUF2958 domain-containing protein [Acidiphilium sp.]|uniref:DUF2958 domain-containing protein n=1 Tax=Acidiphilium sp. TaxID=527 RepID=UPI003D05EA9B